MTTLMEDVVVDGAIVCDSLDVTTATITNTMCHANMGLVRTKFALESNVEYTIPFWAWRVHDDLASNLPGTAAADDLSIQGDTFGTNAPYISAGDLKAAGATSRYARTLIPLPVEYDDGLTVAVKFNAGVLTTVADTSCVIDLELYKTDDGTGIGSDLVTTAAQDINSLTLAEKTFNLTLTGLATGDQLDMRVTITCNDAATGTAVEPVIGAAILTCDIRG